MSESPEEDFDWQQTSGSPAMQEYQRRREARPPLDETGRAIVVLMFAQLLLTELVVIGLLLQGDLPPLSLFPAASRLLLLCGLLYCVWHGMLWRIVLCVLLGTVAILFFSQVALPHPLLGVFCGIYLTIFFGLTCFPPVNRFFAHERLQ